MVIAMSRDAEVRSWRNLSTQWYVFTELKKYLLAADGLPML